MQEKKTNGKSAILLMHCPDQPGIIAVMTEFITKNGGNILYLDQYVDRSNKIFFMRLEWDLENFIIPQDKIEEFFGTLYGQKYNMNFTLYFSDQKPKMAIFVSKMSHCIYDLLARYAAGEWDVEIPIIISNHPDMEII
ncbi:MAG: formyltetrahydrofolate deformylase, partial [Muribaculaceae bacterium]|nr:formyltetrahydrofolate deformylase [Muribaculaceae bacterium]